jgi:hypothetical protein
MFNRGDIVYCENNKQAYVILSIFGNKAVVKNLTNLEDMNSSINISNIKPYPQEWANRDFYIKLSKYFIR